MILDTTEFRHQHLTQPSVTSEDLVLHGIQLLTAVLQRMPNSHVYSQMLALHSLQDAIDAWSAVQAPAPNMAWPDNNPAQPAPTAPYSAVLLSALDRDTWMERLLATTSSKGVSQRRPARKASSGGAANILGPACSISDAVQDDTTSPSVNSQVCGPQNAVIHNSRGSPRY